MYLGFVGSTCVLFLGQRWQYQRAELVQQSFVQPLKLAVTTLHCNRDTLSELEDMGMCEPKVKARSALIMGVVSEPFEALKLFYG